MQQLCEEMTAEFIAGHECSIRNPAAFAELLSAEWHGERWPRILREDLMASSVPCEVTDNDGKVVNKAVHMHKRRVPDSAIVGESTVNVCKMCRGAQLPPAPGRVEPHAADASALRQPRGLPVQSRRGREAYVRDYGSSTGEDPSIQRYKK